ncbi:hypothetical protein ACE6H2_015168 [Prunus campanulata]
MTYANHHLHLHLCILGLLNTLLFLGVAPVSSVWFNFPYNVGKIVQRFMVLFR